jgi:hypothetical protein
MSFVRMPHEATFGRTSILACLALGAFPFLRDASDRESPEVVRTERLELIDAQGRTQAVLLADSLGFTVTLLERGSPTSMLRLNSRPRLTVETGRGREVAGLGAPTVQHLTE